MFKQAYQHIDTRVQQRMAESRTPSLALGMTDQENLLRTSAYGYAELESKTPAVPDTLFEIGSISKTFAAVVTLRAVEDGLIDLHTPVTEYLSWFEIKTNFQPITIHHLLSHSGGLPYSMDFSPDPRAIVYALRGFEVPHAPGERFHYSEVGYQTLTLVLESAYKKPYAEILEEQVFKPLEMSDSAPVINHALRPDLARGYTTLYDDRPAYSSHAIVPAPWLEFNSCDGAIASTVGDMTKFIRMLLNRGAPLISTEGFKLMSTEVVPDWGYGYGLNSWEDEGICYMGHAGDMPGYEAYMWLDITNFLGVVILSSMPAPFNLSWDVLHTLQAAKLAVDLPAFESSVPTKLDTVQDYAGKYQSEGQTFTLIAEGKILYLDLGGTRFPLEPCGPDKFLVPHPDFELFPMIFVRKEGDQNLVTGCYHGPIIFVRDGNKLPESVVYPPEWETYVGHYRSWNPWESNFRVILRNGDLRLVHPDGEEDRLIPRGDGSFHVGDDDLTPEFIRFHQIPADQALRANFSGVDYYRFFTP